MTTTAYDMSPRTTRFLRIAGWSGAVLLLLTPAIAMQLGAEGVHWTGSDFVFAAVIFSVVGGMFELAARASTNLAYRIATVAAVACGFLQIWINLAVGIIGNEDNPANWTYFAVVFIAAAGAIVALGNPRSLRRTMLVAAGAQVAFSLLHWIDGTPTLLIDGFFAALWLVAAQLYGRAAVQREMAA